MRIEESDPAAETDLQRSSKIKATWPSLQGHDGELEEGREGFASTRWIYLEFFPL